MSKNYPHLFSPIKIKNTLFKNRIFGAPNMICNLGVLGEPNENLIAYYEEKARGGAGQVTVGDTPVDEESAPSISRHLILREDRLPYLSELARAIRQHGAVASIELNHGGCASKPAITGHPSIGPTGFVRADGTEVVEMDEAMMDRVADNFAKAAALIKKAGFDMCLLHGAHGWLLGQFLSPYFNKRTDAYGGSLENRARFPIMVIDRVRQSVGRDFLIEYRLSGEELIEGGLTTQEAVLFAKMIEDKIDLLHVSAGLDTRPEQAVYTHPTIFLPHCVNVQYAQAVKKAVRVPVVAVGSIATPEEAERIIAEGQADMVAMTRALIADPWLPNKARQGRQAEITPCLRCLDCLAGMHETGQFSCAVNPRAGRERRIAATANRPSRRLKVLVCGGGPGGMTAAVTAAARGHDVTLCEKTDALGGLLKFTEYDELKQDLRRFKDHLIAMVSGSGIKVCLNTEATPELIETLGPDAVIAAVGSEPVVPKIPGIEKARHALTAYEKNADVGKTVALIGGGLVGCEAGLFLAENGKSVTIIEMQDAIAPEANWMHRTGLMQSLKSHDVTFRTGLKCTEVTDAGVQTVDRDGAAHFIEADTVIYAAGMRARSDTAEGLMGADAEVIAVGDCVRARKARNAVHEAYFAALDLGQGPSNAV